MSKKNKSDEEIKAEIQQLVLITACLSLAKTVLEIVKVILNF